MKLCKYFVMQDADGLYLKGRCALRQLDDNSQRSVIIKPSLCGFQNNPEKCPNFVEIGEE